MQEKNRSSIFSKKGDVSPHRFPQRQYPPMRKCCLMPNWSLCLSPNLNKSSLKIRLTIKVFRLLGEKIIDLQERLEGQVLNNTSVQIINLWSGWQKTRFPARRRPLYFKREFTNRDLANMIGTTRKRSEHDKTEKKEKSGLMTTAI